MCMEKQMSLDNIYRELRKLKEELMRKGIIEVDIPEYSLMSERSLSKEWLSSQSTSKIRRMKSTTSRSPGLGQDTDA